MWVRLAKHAATILATVLLAGLAGGLLVRLAPGFDVDERLLDARLSSSSMQAIREQQNANRNLLSYYGHYLARMAHGDFGTSRMLNRPVRELLRERAPVTALSVLYGLLGGWGLGFTLALLSTAARGRGCDLFASVFSGLFLCIPAAVLALIFLVMRAPGQIAIALIVFPKVFRYSRNLLAQCYNQPYVVTARAKGLGQGRIVFWHVLPNAAPQLIMLVGVSASMALGAAIPVEVICDSAGLGKLAWQAALARDLPLLVNLTLVVTLATMLLNTGSDLLAHAFTRADA